MWIPTTYQSTTAEKITDRTQKHPAWPDEFKTKICEEIKHDYAGPDCESFQIGCQSEIIKKWNLCEIEHYECYNSLTANNDLERLLIVKFRA